MNQPVSLTIYIPTYNRAQLLERTLRLLLPYVDLLRLSSGIDIRVLVSDNASVDRTETVAKSFKYNFFAYHKSQENVGPHLNFYRSINLCKSDYIWLLGDDDFLLNSCLVDVVRILEKTKVDLLFLGALQYPSASSSSTCKVKECSLEELLLECPLTDFGHISRLIYSKKYLLSVPCFDVLVKPDWIWSWIAPAAYRASEIKVAHYKQPAIYATKDGGMDEWSGKVAMPRLLEFEEYISNIATSRESLVRLYCLNFGLKGFPLRTIVVKALLSCPSRSREIHLFVRRYMQYSKNSVFYCLQMRFILFVPIFLWRILAAARKVL